MVRGINKFKEFFAGHEGSYVIIGGTACDILDELALRTPRATKDIDIILVVEALKVRFVKQFWEFVKTGRYQVRQRGNGKHEYFRFMKPEDVDFPLQVEIFSRKPDVLKIAPDARLTPIPIDEDLSSLSAILMNDDYYRFVIEHSVIQNGVRVATVESLIVLKAKAFVDLSERKAKGEAIDSKDIRKHKNDIFRLATMLSRTKPILIPISLQKDLSAFANMVSESLPEPSLYKPIAPDLSSEEVFDLLCEVFRVRLTSD